MANDTEDRRRDMPGTPEEADYVVQSVTGFYRG